LYENRGRIETPLSRDRTTMQKQREDVGPIYKFEDAQSDFVSEEKETARPAKTRFDKVRVWSKFEGRHAVGR
jgi:hypothetical protein